MAGDSKYLTGVAELTRQLDALGSKIKGKALRAAVRAGARPVVKAGKAGIPVGIVEHRTYTKRLVAPGFAKRSVRSVTKLDKTGEKATALIGVRAEAFYATQFVELGTSKRPAHPWLRPAFASTLDAQQTAIAAQLKKQIDKAAKTK